MACWHGIQAKLRYWPGCQYEGRTVSAGAAYLVCRTFKMAQDGEGHKVNHTPHNDESPSESGKGFQGEQLSFLETPEFCPILPPHGSAAEQALNDLLARDLTQIDWLNERKGWRLSAAVKSLGYLGWEPISILVQHPAWPNPIARYSLSMKAKQAAYTLRQGGAHA